MVVQLPPAVSPHPALPPLQLGWCNGNKENFAFCSIRVSLSLGQLVSHTGEREREPKPSVFVLCSHVILCSQRSFFMSSKMDSGWNISAAVGRRFQGLPFSVCFYLSWATLPQLVSLLSESWFHTKKIQHPDFKGRVKHFNLWAFFEADFTRISEGGFGPLYLVLPFVYPAIVLI